MRACPSQTSCSGRSSPVTTVSICNCAPGRWTGDMATINSVAKASVRRPVITRRNPRAAGRCSTPPLVGGGVSGRESLRELRVNCFDLILAPLDGGLEIHLIRAELRDRVDHYELLVDLVRGRRARSRIAHREVILRGLLEGL